MISQETKDLVSFGTFTVACNHAMTVNKELETTDVPVRGPCLIIGYTVLALVLRQKELKR